MEILIIETEWYGRDKETYKLLALDKDSKGFIQCLWDNFCRGSITKITIKKEHHD